MNKLKLYHDPNTTRVYSVDGTNYHDLMGDVSKGRYGWFYDSYPPYGNKWGWRPTRKGALRAFAKRLNMRIK